MPNPIVRVENLGKRYWIGAQRPADSLRDSVAHALTQPLRRLGALLQGHGGTALDHRQPLWALRHADFELHRGEVLGIVGHNGAGKSTLLKILSRITAPTEGVVEITGRIASLLEVGTGFHPDLTGEENIYLNGTILGMTRREIRGAFGDIVAFAGVEAFLNTPVKHYSTGMHTRLAFAVAAHLQSEVLIVDEVLAVGDMDFQRRCFDRMDNVARSGRTILFVSHNLAAVSHLCSRAILLDHGRVVERGAVDHVVGTYLQRSDAKAGEKLAQRTDRQGSGAVRLADVTFSAKGRGPTSGEGRLIAGAPAEVTLRYESAGDRPIDDLRAAFTVTDAAGMKLLTCGTRFQGGAIKAAPPRGTLRCRLPELALVPGRFRMNVWCAVGGQRADQVENAGQFDVVPVNVKGTGQTPDPTKHGPVMLRHDWSLDPAAIDQPQA